MNIFLFAILFILIGDYVLGLVVDILNVKYLKTDLPETFSGYYDEEKYRKSQQYLKENTRFDIITASITTPAIILFILLGGFNWVDLWARGFDQGPIITGLIFGVVLLFGSQVLSLPFSIYSTFVIEEKYGFNKTTAKTFVLDIFKGWMLGIIIGAPVFSGILWFFEQTGPMAWLYCWAALTIFKIILMFVAPVLIMPIFNKFIPLEEGELKTAIEDYAKKQSFTMKGVYTMDGSRRSTKSNAFFTGFGRFRRIVLFDTLIAKHTTEELVSILAHEMGHYKKKHILKSILISIFSTGLMFYILSIFMNNPGLFAAFQMEYISIYASLVFFGFLYAPIDMILSIFSNMLSRRHEYQADAYAVRTYRRPQSMIAALKKLSVDNLSNLTPHPFKVFLSYSHPPVIDRIRAIRGFKGAAR